MLLLLFLVGCGGVQSATTSGNNPGPDGNTGSSTPGPAGGSGGSSGGTASSPAPAVTLNLSAQAITTGQSVTLSWSTTNATSMTITPAVGTAAVPSGTATVTPTETTTYTALATGPGGTATATATVTVNGVPSPPAVSLSVSPNPVTPGQKAKLTWTTSNAAGLTITGVQNAALPSGSADVSAETTTTYTATATGPGGTSTALVTLTVTPPTPKPTVTLNLTPSVINAGQSATLTWTTTDTTALTIAPGISNPQVAGGNATVNPTSTTTYTATATGAGGTTTVTAKLTVNAGGVGSITAVKHIIWMLQENRSFDTYFGKMNDYRKSIGLPTDVDGLPANASNDGIAAFHLLTMCTENTSPFWNESHINYNKNNPTSNTPLNDGFVKAAVQFAAANKLHDTTGKRAMGYYNARDLPYYYFMASQFAISDSWFAPISSNTNANRHYTYAATSSGHVYPWSGAPDTHKTIFDLLQTAGVSWKIYAAQPLLSTFYEFAIAQSAADHIVSIDQYFTDLTNNKLPEVVMIETAALNEHPDNNIQQGAAYASTVINALMNSSAWTDSVFFLSYDEAGALYDHVAPLETVAPDNIAPTDLKSSDICSSGCTGSAAGFTRTGFRVPFIAISPFSIPHYVSHTPADHTAVLKFIEKRYNLPNLSQRDAAQPDISEMFNFADSPNLTPPTPPNQPTNGPCYFDKLP
jgi:phospholipase C